MDEHRANEQNLMGSASCNFVPSKPLFNVGGKKYPILKSKEIWSDFSFKSLHAQ